MSDDTVMPPGRTLSLACPYCSADVVCEIAEIRQLIIGITGPLCATVDVVGEHRCYKIEPMGVVLEKAAP